MRLRLARSKPTSTFCSIGFRAIEKGRERETKNFADRRVATIACYSYTRGYIYIASPSGLTCSWKESGEGKRKVFPRSLPD